MYRLQIGGLVSGAGRDPETVRVDAKVDGNPSLDLLVGGGDRPNLKVGRRVPIAIVSHMGDRPTLSMGEFIDDEGHAGFAV